MFDIAKYLEKFKVMGNSRHFSRNLVVETIQTVCGITLDPKNIEIKDGLVRIQSKPIIKNEIFLKKAKILTLLKEKNLVVQDIV